MSYVAQELAYHGAAPATRVCQEVFLQPGTAVFSNKWYNGLPDDAAAETCTCSCCMSETFSSTYPDSAKCPFSIPTTTVTTTTTTTTTTAAPVARAPFGPPTLSCKLQAAQQTCSHDRCGLFLAQSENGSK